MKHLPEALRGLVDHRCPGHPVRKEKEADIVRSARASSPSLPTAGCTGLWVALCPGGPRAEREAGVVGAGGQPRGREPSAPPWWLPA